MGALSVAGNLVSGYGKFQEGKYESAVLKQNAAMSDAAAKDALNRGSIGAAREQQKGAVVEGEQKAAYGASGVTLAGSPSEVMADTSYFTDLNVQTTMNNAAREAWGYRTKAGQIRSQANMVPMAATLSAGAGMLGGGDVGNGSLSILGGDGGGG